MIRLEMNPNIRDILDFTAEPGRASLVSRAWRDEVLQNERNIIEGLRREYVELDVPDMPYVFIVDNNLEAMHRLTLLRSAINWDSYAHFFMKEASKEMISLTLPYFNITNQVIVAGRRGIILDRYPSLYQTNLRVPGDIKGIASELYYAMLLGDVDLFNRIMDSLSRRWNIIDGTVDDFIRDNGVLPEKILEAVMYYFVDSGRFSPANNGFSGSLVLVRNLIKLRTNPKQDIDNALNAGLELDDIDWILIYLSLILMNDDIELFRQLYDIVGNIIPMRLAFMGGRQIIRYILHNHGLLDYITGYIENTTEYQSLDMQFFIMNLNDIVSSQWSLSNWLQGAGTKSTSQRFTNPLKSINAIHQRYLALMNSRGWDGPVLNQV